MKTTRGLWPTLVEPSYLLACLRESARGKRRQGEVAWALFREDQLVRRLREELVAKRWRPKGFALLRIRDPKRRAIARAPFEDRVVHAALARLIQPVFLRMAVHGDMACRTGFGTHRAVLRVRRYMRAHRFAVHLDIRSYFPSIDPDKALQLVGRRIRDRPFLDVLQHVLDSGRGIVDRHGVREWLGLDPEWPPSGIGLPVGAFTSQVIATHVFLLKLDHFIKRRLRVPGYVRFVDDMILFGDRRADLRGWRAAVGEWLWTERTLRLKHPQARLLSCAAHLDVLGMRVRRNGARPLPRAAHRFRQRVRAAATPGNPPVGSYRSSLQACVHHLLH